MSWPPHIGHRLSKRRKEGRSLPSMPDCKIVVLLLIKSYCFKMVENIVDFLTGYLQPPLDFVKPRLKPAGLNLRPSFVENEKISAIVKFA